MENQEQGQSATPTQAAADNVSPTPSAKKTFSTPFLIILIGLVFILLLMGVIVLLNNSSKVTPTQPITTSQKPTVKLKTEYKNPFEKKTQYVNPFAQYKNPFDNLR